MKLKIFITIFFLSSITLYSQENKSAEETALIILNDAIVFVPAFISVMGFHEVGHYSMAKIFGANDVKFGLFRNKPEGGFQIGWTQLNDSLSSFGFSMFNLGGVMFSRGFSELSALTIKSNLFPTAINRYFAMTYLIGRFDFSRYVLQDALINLLDGEGSDIDNFVTEIAGDATGYRTLTYLSLLTIGVLDLVLNWDDIAKHWSILSGNNYKESNEESSCNFGVYPNRGNLNFMVSINF